MEPEWVKITDCHSVLFPLFLSASVYGRLLCEGVVELMFVLANGRVEYRDIPRANLVKYGLFCCFVPTVDDDGGKGGGSTLR